MKDPLNKTKVVLRHLPPSISQSDLLDQINGRFFGRYKWFSFRAGKISQKNLHHSRAYIDFHRPEDVLEFAEFFDGHVFVNEKGTQFKSLVEYAPSQCVPDVSSKKDGREGTIFKDPDYVEFLEFIAKPVQNLPSAEIQLERREAERTGALKDAVIVTPLMDFIRQKRAAKSGSQRSSVKVSRRVGGATHSSSTSSKRGSEKRRGPSSHVSRVGKTSSTGNDKSTYTIMSRKEEKQLVSTSRAEVSDGTVLGSNGTEPIASGSIEAEKKVVLLKGKEREASPALGGGSLQQQNATASVRNITPLNSTKQSQRHEPSGRIIRSILSNKDRRPPRSPNPHQLVKDNFANISGERSLDDKNDRRLRNKDRPDRGTWAPRLHDGHHAINDTSFCVERVAHKDGDSDVNFQNACGGHGSNSPAENGAQKYAGRRGSSHSMKELDGSPNSSEGKQSKRGVSAGYGSYERRVWVQKSGSGS